MRSGPPVVNHRHGTPDWMPVDIKLRDDLDEAVASCKHYDVMVNAMFDGMNLVAEEGRLVNERDGVSILSERTGAHEELGEFALSVNPFGRRAASMRLAPPRRSVLTPVVGTRWAAKVSPAESARPPRRRAGACRLGARRRVTRAHRRGRRSPGSTASRT
jgi:hypothetical protein